MQQLASKINSKYQVVIPKRIRKTMPSIKPGVDVYVTSLGKDSMKLVLKDVSWGEKYAGIAKGVYGNSDDYLKKIRSDWDDAKNEL